MENNVRVLKLITGEEVITRVTERGDGFIILDKPMQIHTVSSQTGKLRFMIIPWMNIIKPKKITISTEHILVEDDPIEEIEKDYLSIITGLTL
tara:strand:+ start:139 stop:417 length:279 start_codon:yes stop_codon:yes gene_type:complete